VGPVKKDAAFARFLENINNKQDNTPLRLRKSNLSILSRNKQTGNISMGTDVNKDVLEQATQVN